MRILIEAKELTEADFRSLANVERPLCLSLFVGFLPEQNKSIIKALLREAYIKLSQHLGAQTASSLLAPMQSLLHQPDLWPGVGQTLAAFLSDGVFCTFIAPLTLKPRLVVDNRFYLKPLLPCLIRPAHYHVLAISENVARLFSCANQECHEMRSADFPCSLRNVLGARDFSNNLQAHSSGVPGRNPLTYHGHSGPIEEVHQNRILYCRHISAAIERQLGKTGSPLILACVAEYVPAYREVNHYAQLMQEAILGNPDRLSTSEITVPRKRSSIC